MATNKTTFYRANAHLPVKNLTDTLNYYRDVLSFGDEWTFGEDGGIRRDDMRLLFCVDPEFVNCMNTEKHRLNIMWFVNAIDEVFDEFRSKGIHIVSDLKNYPYDLREFAFIDINGYYIRVAQDISTT